METRFQGCYLTFVDWDRLCLPKHKCHLTTEERSIQVKLYGVEAVVNCDSKAIHFMKDSEQRKDWYNEVADAYTLEQRKNWYSKVADAYNRVRPRYPKELICRAVELA